MCGVAWQVIAPMVRQLSLGELVQPSGTWLNDDTIGVFACPDGIRPVIFLRYKMTLSVNQTRQKHGETLPVYLRHIPR